MRPVIREDIELIVDAPAGLPQLFTDPGQIEQVLVNLCLNARDAITESGRITMSLATMLRPVTGSWVETRSNKPSIR